MEKKRYFSTLCAVSFVAMVSACATTSDSGGSTDVVNELSSGPTCDYANELASLEAVKENISSAENVEAAILANQSTLMDIVGRTENFDRSSRPEDVLGCRFLEMEARTLMVELPNLEGQSDLYTAARESVDDVKTMCATTEDARMCSVAGMHDATLFARRSAAELSRVAEAPIQQPINWDMTRSLTQSLTEHIKVKWPEYLSSQSTESAAEESGIERGLFASACALDKAVTVINRRVGMSINKDADGNLVPYGKDSGELLANMVVALDLKPGDDCYTTPEDRACRGRLSGAMHIACLKAGQNAVE